MAFYPAPPPSPIDWAGRFLNNIVSSMGELVGIHPSATQLRWRQDNPTAAFLSELAGFAVPYAGWFKATTSLTRFSNALNRIGNLERAPILTGAARAAARFAPFEAGRVAASQVVGEDPLSTMIGDAVLNLAIEGGVGGLLHGIAAAGTRTPALDRLVPGLDLAAPTQLQTRFIQQELDAGRLTGDVASRAQYRLRELRGLARSEQLPKQTRYVGALAGLGDSVSENVNRLFQFKLPTSSLDVRMLAETRSGDRRGFRRVQDWQTFAAEAGLPANFEDFVQFPRVLTFKGRNGLDSAGKVGRLISGNFEDAGQGWHIAREAEDGLYVIARRVKPAGVTDDAFAQTDRWLLFKTDDPGFFMPGQNRFAKAMVAKAGWTPGAKAAADGGPIYNSTRKFMEDFNLRNYTAMGKTPGGVAGAIDKLWPKAMKGQTNELLARLKDTIRAYMTPARLQFKGSPRANWMHSIYRAAFDSAEFEAQRILNGPVHLDPGKNLFFGAMRGAQLDPAEGSVRSLLNTLPDDKAVGELWQIWRKQLNEEGIANAVKNGEISQQVADVAVRLRKIDSDLWESLNKTQKAVGERPTKRLYGHMMVSRSWEGDHRIILRGDDGSVVGQASGFNRRGAQKNAEKLKKALEDEGIHIAKTEEVDISDVAALPRELRPAILKPGFVMERGNVRGFRWDLEPFTKSELMDAITQGVYGRNRLMASLTTDDLMAGDLAKLVAEDPATYKMLVQRINDLKGVQSTWGAIQNRAADAILAPLLGKNSASRIVQVTNSAMMHLQLGAFKMAYPVMNAMQFLQTVAPEIAYVVGALPETLAGRYTFFASGGTKGPVGMVAAVSPVKFLMQSFREMARPGEELREAMQKAANRRVLDPRLVEEYVGETATKISDFKSAFSSGGGFASWVRALSEWAPAQSERFARAQSFVTGHILGRDYLRLQGEQLFQFAKQFTEHTSYLYTAADRPRIFTTPAGSAFGLFKNWMLNYTASMLEYSGQALKGNWSPLMWQTAGTFAVGGLAATPISLIANGFSNAFFDKSLLEASYDAFGETGGDAVNFGLPAALLGISLYSQAATPLANPVRDANMLFSIAHYDRMQYMSRAMGEAWDHWQVTGENPARNPRVTDLLVRALAPTTLYRLMSAVQEEGINSLASGLPVTMEASPWEKLLYTLGFTPIEMERGLAVANELFSQREARQRLVQNLGQAYAQAMQRRDSGAMRMILRQAVVSGVDASSVLRSANSRLAQQDQDLLERNFRPQDISRLRAVLGE